jgi:hypothetical protein
MRILFDQGVPAPLRRMLTEHSVSTAHEMQWGELSNGLLLKEPNSAFDILITTDQALRFQQNLTGLRLAIIVLPTTDWSIVREHQQVIVAALASAIPGTVLEVSWR